MYKIVYASMEPVQDNEKGAIFIRMLSGSDVCYKHRNRLLALPCRHYPYDADTFEAQYL